MIPQLLIGFLLAAVLALVSFRVRFLTRSGAVAQCVLGTILLGLGGWRWTVPVVVFFVTSSILSHLWKSRRGDLATVFEKTSVRDAAQVAANGGVAGLMVLLWLFTHNEVLYLAYLGAVAAATADTWATEIGTLSRSAPLLITTLKAVERGRSGAVSFAGTAAAVAGSFLAGLSALPWVEGSRVGPVLYIAVIAGLAGMFADSVVGATLQASFRCVVCRRITERTIHCGTSTERRSGIGFITNDAVNLVCTLVGALVGAVLAYI